MKDVTSPSRSRFSHSQPGNVVSGKIGHWYHIKVWNFVSSFPSVPLPCLLSLLSPGSLFSPSPCNTLAVFWSLLFPFSCCWAVSVNQQLCYLTILFYTLSPFEMASFLPLFLLLTGLVFLAFKPKCSSWWVSGPSILFYQVLTIMEWLGLEFLLVPIPHL